MSKLKSCVIVINSKGAVATIRFEEGSDDKIFSSPNKPVLYILIEKYISEVLNEK